MREIVFGLRGEFYSMLVRSFKIISRLLGTTLVLLLFSPSPATRALSSDPFCLLLEKIIQSGENKFQFITGKMEMVSEEHIGLLIPPKFERCFGWVDGMAYHCEGLDGMSENKVAKAFDDQVRSFDNCLSSAWEMKETTVLRASGRRRARFSTDLTRVSIELSERHKRQGWFVDVYFRR